MLFLGTKILLFVENLFNAIMYKTSYKTKPLNKIFELFCSLSCVGLGYKDFDMIYSRL